MGSMLPLLLTAALFVLGTWAGRGPAKLLLQRYEAMRGLEAGSASRLRLLQGWWIYLLWLGPVWFVAAFLGDWAMHGDVQGAFYSAFSVVFFLGDATGLLDP